MIGRTLSFVFLLVFVPSIVHALKCSYGGTCVPLKDFSIYPPKLNTYKNCKKSCVYFNCFIDDDKYIKHGYGCREDFERLCPHHASTKEYNVNDIIVDDDGLIFSCNDSDDCAMKKMRTISKKVTTSNTTIDQSADEKCIYDEDEEMVLASGEIFFDEFYEDESYNKTYIAFFVCFIVILFGPYVYYEFVIG